MYLSALSLLLASLSASFSGDVSALAATAPATAPPAAAKRPLLPLLGLLSAPLCSGVLYPPPSPFALLVLFFPVTVPTILSAAPAKAPNAPLNTEWDYQELLHLLDEARDVGIHTFTIRNDELTLLFFGVVPSIFTRLSEEEYAWWESLRPKGRLGDISHVEIDYGASEHFSREQMVAAMEIVKERFRDKYAGCELHQLSYSSDARSAWAFEYYAGRQSPKTGNTYVDGIVFLSSFHTPSEDKEAPDSDLEPDKEYIDWNWILLLTENGEWELVTWGY